MRQLKGERVCGLAIAMVSVAWVMAGAAPKEHASAAGRDKPVGGRVNGREVTYDEMDREVSRGQVRYLEWAYRARLAAFKRIAVRSIVEERSQRSGESAVELLRRAVDVRCDSLGDDVLRRWWEEHEEMLMAQGQTFEESLERVEEQVYAEQEEAIWNLLYEAVLPGSQVEVLFAPPRVEIPVSEDDATRGSHDATVEIVEFCDFR